MKAVVEMQAGKLNITIRELISILVALIIAALFIVQQVWGISGWKNSVDTTLQSIKDQLQTQQKQLDWFKEHWHEKGDGNEPMSMKKPKVSVLIPPDVAYAGREPQMATIPNQP